MHVAIIGSHCTGKTTLLNALKKEFPDYIFVDEYIKTLQDMSVPFNEVCTDMTQYIASDICIDAFKHKNFISDRSLLDVLAYSRYLCEKNVISKECYDEIRLRWEAHNIDYDILFYAKPLKQEIENNGIRSTDQEFQKGVQDIFEQFLFYEEYQWLYDEERQEVYQLPNDLDERIKFVKEKIDEFTKCS